MALASPDSPAAYIKTQCEPADALKVRWIRIGLLRL